MNFTKFGFSFSTPAVGPVALKNQTRPSRRVHAAMVRVLLPTMSVVENVTVGAFVRYPRMLDALNKAHEVLDYVGLTASAEASASELTPPQKRRLEVARALATEPKLLLLDEVLTGLTPSEARAGVELIRKIRETGVTVVMVEHVMEVVMPLVDRAVVLHLGKVLAEGKPADVVRNDDVITAYLGERHRAA